MKEWIEGAQAEIMVSEHPGNIGRIVTLMHGPFSLNGFASWGVEDGQPFTAYDPDATVSEAIDVRKRSTRMTLCIEQWKLRLI